MRTNEKGKKPESCFVATSPEKMCYHEYLECWLCKCGNIEILDGFNASDKKGNLIEPKGAKYCRCERCGRVIEIRTRTIIGINPNPDRGRF